MKILNMIHNSNFSTFEKSGAKEGVRGNVVPSKSGAKESMCANLSIIYTLIIVRTLALFTH
jgi:hypothetical protein